MTEVFDTSMDTLHNAIDVLTTALAAKESTATLVPLAKTVFFESRSAYTEFRAMEIDRDPDVPKSAQRLAPLLETAITTIDGMSNKTQPMQDNLKLLREYRAYLYKNKYAGEFIEADSPLIVGP